MYSPLVTCLLPTFNRIPRLTRLLEEAVQCFLLQDYPNKELILCNDTPGQEIHCDFPQVRVINSHARFPTLGDKLHWMIEQAEGEYMCRWDDDDISLPWRLSLSVEHLAGGAHREWRPENHWYTPVQNGELAFYHTQHPGNTHIMSIWHRDLLRGLTYPGRPCPSGLEDQTFNSCIWEMGYPRRGTVLPLEDIFYLYRWGTGSKHLSGGGGGQKMQDTYVRLAEEQITAGYHMINPRWHLDYKGLAKAAAARIASEDVAIKPPVAS